MSETNFTEPDGCIFTEAWCSDREKISIEHALNSVEAEGAYIEIGCFEGRSTVFTANLINPKTLHAVDPWSPVADAPYEVKVYGERPIEQNFLHNIAVGTSGNVEVHKMRWEEFFQTWDGPIAYLYLDGPHQYDNVMESLRIITPFIAKGGVILGDDYDDDPVAAAAHDFFGVTTMASPVLWRHFYWKNN